MYSSKATRALQKVYIYFPFIKSSTAIFDYQSMYNYLQKCKEQNYIFFLVNQRDEIFDVIKLEIE